MDEITLRKAAEKQLQKANDLRQQGTAADAYRDEAQRLRIQMNDYLRRVDELQRQIDDLEIKADYADKTSNTAADAYEHEAERLAERANQAAVAEAKQRIRDSMH